MSWIKQAVVNLTAVVAVVGIATLADAQAKPATAPAAPRVAKSPYWDKPLVLPPNVDALLPKLPPPVAQWLTKWKTDELAGKSATDEQITELNQLINDLPTPVDYLAPLVAIIANLDGNKTALPLCDSVLNRAGPELKPFAPGDPAVKPAVDALWLLHPVLWDSQQYAIDQKLLELVRPWEVYGSAHSQWVSYLYAEAMQMQSKYAEAHDAYVALERERSISIEPSEGTNRGLDWEMGMTLCQNEQYEQALPYLRRVVAVDGVERRDSMQLLIRAASATGNADEARQVYDEFLKRYQPSAAEIARLADYVITANKTSK